MTSPVVDLHRLTSMPSWVNQQADDAHEIFSGLAREQRLALFARIATAGFNPVSAGEPCLEFEQRIAPNAALVLIAEAYPWMFEKGHAEAPFGWFVFSCDSADKDVFESKICFCHQLVAGIADALQLAEEKRSRTLRHPNAWEPRLAERLTHRGVDWARNDWRMLVECDSRI